MAYSKAYAKNFAAIDWSGFKLSQSKRTTERKGKAPLVMPDIAEFVSPVNYELISSRSQLRAHERRHGVRQCGELKTATEFDPYKAKPQAVNEKALERAFGIALQKTGHA